MKFNQREEGIKKSKQNQTVIDMEIAKHVFHLATINHIRRMVENKRLNRKEVLDFSTNVTPTTIAVEACASAHYWGERTCETVTHGAAVASSDSEAIRAGQHKIDNIAAMAIPEAARRPRLDTVPVKTEQQNDQQALHEWRQSLIKMRIPINMNTLCRAQHKVF